MDPLPIRDLRPNVGDRLYMRARGTTVFGDKEVGCTVIAHDPKDTMQPYLVGWLREEANIAAKFGVSDTMMNGRSADPRLIPGCQCLPHIMQYVFSEWIYSSTICTLDRSQGGMKCAGRFCGVYVQYATPNQKDGSFLCYSCRQRPLCMTQTTKE